MSHFTVIVFGEEDLDAALEPFNENLEVEPCEIEVSDFSIKHAHKLAKESGMKGRNPSPERLAKLLSKDWGESYFARDGKVMESSTSNPKGQWDWWVLGGRWRGYFPLKESVTYEPKSHLGEPGTSESIAIRDGKGPDANYEKKHVADSTCLKDIDFERCEREAEGYARESFARWKDVFLKHPRPTSWSAVCGDDYSTVTMLERKAYQEQPAIVAYKKLKKIGWGCPADTFGFDEEAYVTLCKGSVLVPFAIIHNGEWIGQEDGSSGTRIDDPAARTWNLKIHALYKSLPGDTTVAMVDCHT